MRIRAWSPDVCSSDLAVHRFPGSRAGRIQAVARAGVDDYDGDVTRLWRDGDPDGPEVLRRLRALPGFGEQKARIFLALLGKQRGVRPSGWQEAAGAYADDDARRSIADVTAAASPADVRATQPAAQASPDALPAGNDRVS